MSTATKIGKICGKEYPYCRTERKVAGVFRWQDVACCVEHGSIYLERVLASRGEKPESQSVESTEDEVKASDGTTSKSATKKKSRKTSARSTQ